MFSLRADVAAAIAAQPFRVDEYGQIPDSALFGNDGYAKVPDGVAVAVRSVQQVAARLAH
jgi:hypothetical protein